MAQYGTIYRLQWNTVPSVMSGVLTIPAQVMIVDIYDTENLIEDSDIPEIISLLADANPLVIKIINNDEDKFSPIRAKQAIIQFKSDANQFEDSLTFVDQIDNKWYVEITADGQFIFKGFLMPTDIQQDHLPDPNTVVLTASDHLALLKDIALTTDSFVNPLGKLKIGELIGLCLKKTGLRLEIIVVNNLRHGSGSLTTAGSVTFFMNVGVATMTVDASDIGFFYTGQQITITGTPSSNGTYTVLGTGVLLVGFVLLSVPVTPETAPGPVTFQDTSSLHHFYDTIYLDVLTFEKSIGESEDCNTVLEKILGEDCFLTQWKGAWYIMRVDEFDGNPIYECVFNVNGAFSNFNTPTTYLKNIGASETRRLANADALRRYDRPYGSIREVADLNFPLEIPCNSDFGRGDFIANLPDETNSDGIVQQVEKYELDCWDFLSRQGGVANQIGFYGQPPIANSAAYVKKYFTNGDETNRKLVIETPTASGTGVPYVRSMAIPMGVGDKIDLSVELDYTNIGSHTGYVDTPIMVEFYSNSGKRYWWIAYDILNPTMPPRWQLTPDTGGGSVIGDMYFGASLEDDSLNISLTSPPLPESGDVYIYLINFYADQITANYSNLSITPIPLINGSYKRYTKFHNKVSRDPQGYFNAFREKQVYIFDSPKPLFKGAMFFYNGTAMILTSLWYSSNHVALGPPASLTDVHPYGWLQAYSVWNQFKLGNRILSSSELGLGSMWPDALDKVQITDTNPHVNDRYFMLISFEQNWKTALWSGVFIEDYRTDIDKDYTSPHELKYLTK